MNKKVYWKATYYEIPEKSFEVTVANNSNPECYVHSIYSFCSGDGDDYKSGIFTIRDSKIGAINALKDNIKEKISAAEKSIEEMKTVLNIMNETI